MFYFFIQYIDLLAWGVVGLFMVFYALSWVTLLVKLYVTGKYEPKALIPLRTEVSVVIPVYNEPFERFEKCLNSIWRDVCKFDRWQITVVENGACTPEYSKLCEKIGADYISLEEKGKRKAIAEGLLRSKYQYTVLLDSDTIATPGTIERLLAHFRNPKVGGVVPRQEVVNNGSFWGRICDWYEEIRFGNTTPGLSHFRAIPCLIGRLYAVRTAPVLNMMGDFVSQKVLGFEMETGDDRVITNYLLQDGYETVYDSNSLVYTYAPENLKTFAKQRLRWSRSSFSETVLAITWLWKHPYAFFVMWSDIVMRWFFFVIVFVFSLKAITWSFDPHVLDLPLWIYVAGGALGFFFSGFLKQLPHLSRKPGDLLLTPAFLLITTFILTPIEWYGNLTCLDRGRWLTRNKNEKNIGRDFAFKQMMIFLLILSFSIFLVVWFTDPGVEVKSMSQGSSVIMAIIK